MVKLNTPKINIVIKSVNHVNLVKNSLRQVLPYLTNRTSTKCGNWCDGKVQYTNDQCCDKISVNNVNLEKQDWNTDML